jgi:hypothetical protein
MANDDLALGFMLAGWCIWMVGLGAYSKIQTEVARLAPPKTNVLSATCSKQLIGVECGGNIDVFSRGVLGDTL